MPTSNTLFPKKLIEHLHEYLRASRHRALVVLAGEQAWGLATAANLKQRFAERDETFLNPAAWWISDSATHGGKDKLLGCEFVSAIYNAYFGFDPETFGALSGTIAGGGVLILIVPPLNEWHTFDDVSYESIAVFPFKRHEIQKRFMQRFARIIRDDARSILIEESGAITCGLTKDFEKFPVMHDNAIDFTDQKEAIDAIRHVVFGHRKRPLVIVSDRGRGKSSALGIAAAMLLNENIEKIIVTAPRVSCVDTLFLHARALLPDAVCTSSAISYCGKSIEFVPPDELMLIEREANLVIVDEAAAIPAHILSRILDRYSRIVFSTTIHGYEGTGRGFALRFYKTLDNKTPNWKLLTLNAPIRWSRNDPLEEITFKALLLNASPIDETVVTDVTAGECDFIQIDRTSLLQDEQLLSTLFGLLVIAHYRTTPSDLRNLLDGPNVRVYALRFRSKLVATALVADEGTFDEPLANDIYLGMRRVRGHLIPQSLIFHEGHKSAAKLRCARIMRIAVHPAFMRRGLGRELVAEISRVTKGEGYDYLAASFGATADLLHFWRSQMLLPVRVGLTKDHSSGEYSVFVMKAFSNSAEKVFTAVREKFSNSLPLLLSDPLRDLDFALAAQLMLAEPSAERIPLSEVELRDIDSFVNAQRGYDVNILAINKLVCSAFADGCVTNSLNERHQHIMVMKVLQKKNWSAIVKSLSLPGQAAAIALLQEAVKATVNMQQKRVSTQ